MRRNKFSVEGLAKMKFNEEGTRACRNKNAFNVFKEVLFDGLQLTEVQL